IFSQNPIVPEQAINQLLSSLRAAEVALYDIALFLARCIYTKLSPQYYARCLIKITQHEIFTAKSKTIDDLAAKLENSLNKLQASLHNQDLTSDYIDQIRDEIMKAKLEQKPLPNKQKIAREAAEIIAFSAQDAAAGAKKFSSKMQEYVKKNEHPIGKE